MAWNIENMIINKAIRGTMFDKSTDEVYFSIDKIADPSLECGGETVYANDAQGVPIAGFDRSKTATLSGSNAMFNFGLMAAQLGSDKVVATDEAKIAVPKFELIKVTDATKITLTIPEHQTLVDTSVKYIYSTNSDKSKNMSYARGIKFAQALGMKDILNRNLIINTVVNIVMYTIITISCRIKFQKECNNNKNIL